MAGITAVSVVVSILATLQSMKEKARGDRAENNLYTKTIEYQDELGRKVTETTQLEITVRELKQIAKKDTLAMNAYEKKLYKISQELAYNNRKEKTVDKAMMFSTESNFSSEKKAEDIIINKMPAKTVKFIDTFGTYEATYFPETDNMKISVLQRNEFFLDIYKQRELNKKGKKVFYLWRWTKDWEYKGSVKSLNDSTIIKDFTLINVQKK